MTTKNRFFRRLVAGVFLLTFIAAPLQVVFACDLMDGQASRVCCCGGQMDSSCEMGGGCDMSSAQAGPSCCQVFLDDLSVVSATAGSHFNTLHPQDDPQPRLALSGPTNPPPLTPIAEFTFNIPPDPSWHRGTQTYLVTLRLRD